jgi:Na+-translocating ferredoxin:NAD+ oxidoreductase subunit E
MSHTTPREDFARGVWKENPVFIQGLGLCPALAVTNTLANGIAMSLATAFVLVSSSVIISSLRSHIPKEVRISAYILIIATFVTIVDLVMAAVVPVIYGSMAAFIALIVANCMILGRQEAFAARHTVGRSFLDAVGTSAGFMIALVLMSGLRELLGNGTLLEVPVLGPSFEPWVIMVMPPGGFFAIGLYLLLFGWWAERRERGQRVEKRGWPHPAALQRTRRTEEVVA